MSSSRLQRPGDDEYYVEPWSSTFLQGDVFTDVPLAIAAPPDAVTIDDGERRFVSGPFDATLAMLISPSCSIAAQGPVVPTNAYAHPVRTLVPLRPIEELVSSGAVPETNLNHLRSDRLRNYIYLPAGPSWPESAALLHMPISMHHDVIAENRVSQLTGEAYWHLRVKLMAFFGGFLLDPSELGAIPAATERAN